MQKKKRRTEREKRKDKKQKIDNASDMEIRSITSNKSINVQNLKNGNKQEIQKPSYIIY